MPALCWHLLSTVAGIVMRFLGFMIAAYFVMLVTGCDPQQTIMQDLSQRDANFAMVTLRQQQIDVKKTSVDNKKKTSFIITVKKSQADQALALLVQHGLPRTERASLKDVYPVQGGGLIPSKTEELARLLMASQGEVEAMLKVIPGIEDVRVVFSLDPPVDVFKTSAKKTASVVVIYQTSSSMRLESPLDDAEVQALVSASIAGLVPENVSVVQKPNTALMLDDKMPEVSMPIEIVTSSDKRTFWSLVITTILSLLLASFGLFRLLIMRRKLSVLSKA